MTKEEIATEATKAGIALLPPNQKQQLKAMIEMAQLGLLDAFQHQQTGELRFEITAFGERLNGDNRELWKSIIATALFHPERLPRLIETKRAVLDYYRRGE